MKSYKIFITIIISALFLVFYLTIPKQSFSATCQSGEASCGPSWCCENSNCHQGCYNPNDTNDCRIDGCIGDPLCGTGYTGGVRCNITTGKCENVCPNDSDYCVAGATYCTPNLKDIDGNPVPQCGTGGTCDSATSKCQTCSASYSCTPPSTGAFCSASGEISGTFAPISTIKKLRFRLYQSATNVLKCDSLGGRYDADTVFWDGEGCGTLNPNNKWSTANQYSTNTFSSTLINRDSYLINVSFGSSQAGPVFGGPCKYSVDCQSATPLVKVQDDCEAAIGTVVGGQTVNSRVMSATVAAVCGPNSSNVGVSFKTMSTLPGTPYYPMFAYYYPASPGAGAYSTTLCGGVSANGLAANTSTSVSDQIPTRYGPGTSHNLTCTVARGANSTDGSGNAQREWSFDGTTKITNFTGVGGNTYKIAIDSGTSTGTCPNTNTNYVLCPNYKIRGKVFKSNDGGTTWPVYSGARLTLNPGGVTQISDANGYNFSSLSSGTYTVTLDPASIPGYWVISPASGNYTNLTVPSGATGVHFYIIPIPRSISGSVFLDSDGDSVKDAGEPLYSGATLTLSIDKTDTDVSDNTGYSFLNLLSGSYRVTLTVPNGHRATTPTFQNITITSSDIIGVDFGITPYKRISGDIIIDMDGDGIKDPEDTQIYNGTDFTIDYNKTGGIDIETLSYRPGGYTINSATAGNSYTVGLNLSPTSGYRITSINTFSGLRVGSNCSVPASAAALGANCAGVDGFEIFNLNFLISPKSKWFQGKGGDMRIDSGFSDPITRGAVFPYASLVNSNGTPGVVFSGNWGYDFGSGDASEPGFNWIAGGTSNPDVYPSRKLTASYAYMNARITQRGIPKTDLSTKCAISNCTLPALVSDFPGGVYYANLGGLGNGIKLNEYNFPNTNSDYVFLIDGDLRINGNIDVPTGATASFFVSGDIIVNPQVGVAAANNSTTFNLDGIYSAGRHFYLLPNSSQACPNNPGKRLNIQGSVIVNTALGTGTNEGRFVYDDRDLCDDSKYPIVYIEERPDFYLSLPSYVLDKDRIWREVAP